MNLCQPGFTLTKLLQELIIDLESNLPRLIVRRNKEPMANDCYEAADDWVHLGKRALNKDTRVNFPERVKGELILHNQLRDILLSKSQEGRIRPNP
jgi:hypothetical protein